MVASGLRRFQGVAVNGQALYAALKRVVALAPLDGAVARFPLLPGGALGGVLRQSLIRLGCRLVGDV